MNGLKIVGAVFIIIGVIGALGVLGDANPLAFISDPLFNLTKLFLTDVASMIFWGIIIFLGLTFLSPKGGYIKTIVRKR